MSTREQRRDWQDFREAHGVTVGAFKVRWKAMFGRDPKPHELEQYVTKRKELREPLGRHKRAPEASLVTVTKRYEWDMGHRLPQHDGKCSRLHGHRYVAEIDVTGPLQTEGSSTGMVVDFYILKQALDACIGVWDHRTMLHIDDAIFQSQDNDWHWGVFRVPFMPTAENMAREILRLLTLQQLNITRVRVYETPSGWAEVKA